MYDSYSSALTHTYERVAWVVTMSMCVIGKNYYYPQWNMKSVCIALHRFVIKSVCVVVIAAAAAADVFPWNRNLISRSTIGMEKNCLRSKCTRHRFVVFTWTETIAFNVHPIMFVRDRWKCVRTQCVWMSFFFFRFKSCKRVQRQRGVYIVPVIIFFFEISISRHTRLSGAVTMGMNDFGGKKMNI